MIHDVEKLRELPSNEIRQFLKDATIVEKINAPFFIIKFDKRSKLGFKILKNRSEKSAITDTDILLNSSLNPIKDFAHSVFGNPNNRWFIEKYDEISITIFNLYTPKPLTIDYKQIYDQGVRFIVSNHYSPLDERLNLPGIYNDIIKASDGYINTTGNKITLLERYYLDVGRKEDFDFRISINSMIDGFKSGEYGFVDLLYEYASMHSNLGINHFCNTSSNYLDIEGFIITNLRFGKNKSYQITFNETPRYQESDITHLYYELVIKDFIRFYSEIKDSDLILNLLGSNSPYINTVTVLFKEYVMNCDMEVYDRYNITEESLLHPVAGFRAPMALSYIPDQYVRQLCDARPLYKSIYSLLMSNLRFFRNPSNARDGIKLTDSEYSTWNTLVVELIKLPRNL